MREKFRRFMAGRYGNDSLNQAMSIACIVMLLIAMVTKISPFYWVGLVLLVLSYFRMFSRNISARTAENYKYYTLTEKARTKVNQLRTRWSNRKVYHYYRCPKCRQQLRVPRGRGRIQISCPKCGTQFVKKS